jgi:hypothetical protein
MERWDVKREGQEGSFALTNHQADAELLVERLNRTVASAVLSAKFYARRRTAVELLRQIVEIGRGGK